MFVTVNGARLYFDVEGASLVPDGPRMREKPTLILLHGGPGFDHTLFKPGFSALSDVAQVIYLDQRGQGRSSGTPETMTLAQWGDDVKGFCDVLGIEKPIVCGVSFGGHVAQAYATRHPEHPAKLILSSTAAKIDYEIMFTAFARIGGREKGEIARAYWLEPTMERRLRYIAECVPLYRAKPADQHMMSRAIIRHDVGLAFNGPANEQGRMDFRADLARIRCPVLVMAGGLDPIMPMEFSETIAACLPPHLARFERFPDCGHGVHVDDPQRGFAVMREFILA